MDFFDVVKNRGSYRGEFKKGEIPKDDLLKILDAGIRAPSGGNLQSTSFYAVTDYNIRSKLAEIFPTPTVKTAPVILVVTSKVIPYGENVEMQFEIEDYAAAVENILLAITALGYAGVWMDGMMRSGGRNEGKSLGYAGVWVDEMMKSETKSEQVHKLLQISQDETARTIIPFGIPIDMVVQKEKKPLSERAHII